MEDDGLAGTFVGTVPKSVLVARFNSGFVLNSVFLRRIVCLSRSLSVCAFGLRYVLAVRAGLATLGAATAGRIADWQPHFGVCVLLMFLFEKVTFVPPDNFKMDNFKILAIFVHCHCPSKNSY